MNRALSVARNELFPQFQRKGQSWKVFLMFPLVYTFLYDSMLGHLRVWCTLSEYGITERIYTLENGLQPRGENQEPLQLVVLLLIVCKLVGNRLTHKNVLPHFINLILK